MKIAYIIGLSMLTLATNAFPQDTPATDNVAESNVSTENGQTYRNIYGELFGASNFIGVTYDSRFKPGSKWGFRAGLAYALAIHPAQMLFYHGSDHAISVPLAVNGIFGKGNSFFEAGIGFSPGITFSKYDDYRAEDLPDGSVSFIKEGSHVDTRFYSDIFMDLGYRYQRPSGFMFRAGISPALNMVGSWSSFVIRPYISFGYTFK